MTSSGQRARSAGTPCAAQETRVLTAATAIAAAATALTACTAPDGERPAATTSTTTTPVPLATVDPALIDGFDVRVNENLDRNHLLYVAVAVVPGLEAWADAQQAALAPRLERFVAETQGANAEPYPELMVGWDVVAASPEVVGMRVHTSELGPDATFDGSSWVAYYDVAGAVERPSQDLLADGAEVELAARVQAAAAENPVIAPDLLEEQLAGDRESFDALAFTPDGDAVAAVVGDLGMSQINWNVDPEDWKDRDSAVVSERVLASTKNGSIVLSHDIPQTTRDAAAGIIEGLRAQGLTLVAVPDLLDDVQPGQLYYSRRPALVGPPPDGATGRTIRTRDRRYRPSSIEYRRLDARLG